MPEKRVFLRVFGAASIVSLGGVFGVGYQMTVINPTEPLLTSFINSSFHDHYGGTYITQTQWSYVWPSITSLMPIGCFLGTSATGYVAESIGRKRGMYITHVISILAFLLLTLSKFANSWEMFASGRLLSGVEQGLHLGLQPVYFNEISPKSIRGLIGSVSGFAFEFGLLVASILALPIVLGTDTTWPYLFLIPLIPTVISSMYLYFLPESPKFLAFRGDSDGAKEALKFFGRSSEDIEMEMKEIDEEISAGQLRANRPMSLREIFVTPHVRKGLILGCVIALCGIYSGFTALSFFSTSILVNSGLSLELAQYAILGVSAPGFVGTLVGGFVLDRCGRRPLILGSLAVLVLLNVLFIVFANLARVHAMIWAEYANIGVMVLIIIVDGLGLANVVWFMTTELVPQRARSKAQMITLMSLSMFNLSNVFLFYPLSQAVNEFCFLVNVIPLTFALLYLFWALPETKNKKVIEIMRELGYHGEESMRETVRILESDVLKF